MKNIIKVLFVLLSLSLLITLSNAQSYYADSSIVVFENGDSSVNGTTDSNIFSQRVTSEFTYKNSNFWTFVINTDEYFSDYIITITFPKGTEINSVITNSNYRLATENDVLKVIIFGENSKVSLNISYSLLKSENISFVQPLFIAILLVVIIFILWFSFRKIDLSSLIKKKDQTDEIKLAALTERQSAIINYLKSKGNKATQIEISKALLLPKASLSRNIEGLIRKDLILRERKGLTMLIMLKKK